MSSKTAWGCLRVVEMIVGRLSMSSEDVYQSKGRHKAKIALPRPHRLRYHLSYIGLAIKDGESSPAGTPETKVCGGDVVSRVHTARVRPMRIQPGLAPLHCDQPPPSYAPDYSLRPANPRSLRSQADIIRRPCRYIKKMA